MRRQQHCKQEENYTNPIPIRWLSDKTFFLGEAFILDSRQLKAVNSMLNATETELKRHIG